MNCYSDLTTIKSRLNIDSTDYDTDLLALLNAASRQIDRFCNRFFYVMSETRYFNGANSPIFLDDLLNVTTFKLDEDGDGTYEETMATTDYVLYPLNSYPKTYAMISSDSNYGSFASGIKKGVEITGDFGYGDGKSATPYIDAGTDVNEASGVTVTATTITVDDGTKFGAGQTILIDSEQMYIKSISSNTLTVTREVNGTTATTHDDNSDIYIYQYPDPIMEAVLIQAMRFWKRKDSAFQDAVGSPELGQLLVYKGMDADIKLIIDAYQKRSF
jgi:hypothetical protein